MSKVIIRNAEYSDLQSLLEIYNYEVENGIATLDIEPQTLKEREVWFNLHLESTHPLIVLTEDGMVAGYASLSKYREKQAYSCSAELSVYIHKDFRNKGYASALMRRIIEIARENETLHTIVSVITSGNEISVKLHKKFGFEYCGTIKEVAYKFGKYIDIDNYRLTVK